MTQQTRIQLPASRTRGAMPVARSWKAAAYRRVLELARRPALALLAGLLLGVPVLGLVWQLLSAQPSSVSALRGVLMSASTWHAAGFSLGLGLLSTLVALVLGLPAGRIVGATFPGRSVLRLLVTLPLVLPPLVLALGFQRALGGDGWADAPLGALGIEAGSAARLTLTLLLAHIAVGTAIVAVLSAAAESMSSTGPAEAARLLGAHGWARYSQVEFPAQLPMLALAAVLVFVHGITSMSAGAVLGQSVPATASMAAWRALRFGDPDVAAVLGMLPLAVTVPLVLAGALRGRRFEVGDGGRTRRPSGLALIVCGIAATLLVVLPIVALLRDLLVMTAGGLTAADVRGAWREPRTREALAAARLSLQLALGGAIAGVVLAFLATVLSRGVASRVVRVLVWLPLAVPAVALAIGVSAAMEGRVVFAHSLVPVALAHAGLGYAAALPVLRYMLRTPPPQLVEGQRLIGRVSLLLEVGRARLLRAGLAALLLASVVSLGDPAASAALSSERETLPLLVARLISQADNASVEAALVIALLFLVTSMAVLLTLIRLGALAGAVGARR